MSRICDKRVMTCHVCVTDVTNCITDLFLDGIQMTYAKLIKAHFMSLAYVICMPFKNLSLSPCFYCGNIFPKKVKFHKLLEYREKI
jgi:hypothetical protein